MYNLMDLTEEQVSVILQALEYWRYNCRHVSLEQWDIAKSVIEKIDEMI